tara:strand:- start:3246 stop:3536 length:291 start_codon:yes stop_codon:yes gene_type:complete
MLSRKQIYRRCIKKCKIIDNTVDTEISYYDCIGKKENKIPRKKTSFFPVVNVHMCSPIPEETKKNYWWTTDDYLLFQQEYRQELYFSDKDKKYNSI